MARSPSHRLVIQEKANTKNQTKAGVAWTSPEGYLSIRLNPGITLSHRDCEDFFISLYPIDQWGPRTGEGMAGTHHGQDQDDDDIPF